jgi:hypothetical protein
MKSNDTTVIEFYCPKPLAESLDRMAKAEYSSKSAVLRRLIAAASVSHQTTARLAGE